MKRRTAAVMVLAALTIGLILGRWSTGTGGESTTSTSTTTTERTVGWDAPKMKKWATPKPKRTTTAGGPRAQQAADLTFPPGSEILAAEDTALASYERWQVKGTREFLESYLTPQLPISKEYDGLPWCKTVTLPKQTQWVWANSDGYLMITVGEG